MLLKYLPIISIIIIFCACGEATLPYTSSDYPQLSPYDQYKTEEACERKSASCAQLILSHRKLLKSKGTQLDQEVGVLELISSHILPPIRIPVEVELGIVQAALYLPSGQYIFEAKLTFEHLDLKFVAPRIFTIIEADQTRTVLFEFTRTSSDSANSADSEDVNLDDQEVNDEDLCQLSFDHRGGEFCVDDQESHLKINFTEEDCLKYVEVIIFDDDLAHPISSPIDNTGRAHLSFLREGAYFAKILRSPPHSQREIFDHFEFNLIQCDDQEVGEPQEEIQDETTDFRSHGIKIYSKDRSHVINATLSVTQGLSILSFQTSPRLSLTLTEGELIELSYMHENGAYVDCLSSNICMNLSGSETQYLIIFSPDESGGITGEIQLLLEDENLVFEINL